MTVVKTSTSIYRTHEIDVGHRVWRQGGKCENLHGHRYKFEFHVRGNVNDIGMVVDFGTIKETLCEYLERQYDHRMLICDDDPLAEMMNGLPGVTFVPFNPTAENIAEHLLTIGRQMLPLEVELWKVVVHETGKCVAEATREVV